MRSRLLVAVSVLGVAVLAGGLTVWLSRLASPVFDTLPDADTAELLTALSAAGCAAVTARLALTLGMVALTSALRPGTTAHRRGRAAALALTPRWTRRAVALLLATGVTTGAAACNGPLPAHGSAAPTATVAHGSPQRLALDAGASPSGVGTSVGPPAQVVGPTQQHASATPHIADINRTDVAEKAMSVGATAVDASRAPPANHFPPSGVSSLTPTSLSSATGRISVERTGAAAPADSSAASPARGWLGSSVLPDPLWAAVPAPGWVPSTRPPAPLLPAADAALVTSGAQHSGGPLARAGRARTERVVVRRGDSLWSIAARDLGPGASDAEVAAQWPRWWHANRAVIGPDPDLILPGTRLRPPPPADVSSLP
jgi:nucleoid-associated protein YgaU